MRERERVMAVTIIIQVFLLFLTICSDVGHAKPPSKLINALESYTIPYQVSLQNSLKENFCGGAILDARHILTAAHCVNDTIIKPYALPIVVIIGTNDKNDWKPKNLFRVIKKTIHEDFGVNDSLNNDIAVLKLDRSITFNVHRRPIKLPISDTAEGTELMASGWGATQWSELHQVGDAFPRFLRFYYGVVISLDKCQEQMVHHRLNPGQICIWSGGKGTSCQGDSGSPLTDGIHIIGITSFNYYCNQLYADVFTRVYHYVDWIRKAMDD